MADTRGEFPELGSSTLIRRERLERIASAERDRRADRVGLAIAAIGEAVEWPARAVLALARLPESEGVQTRRVLEKGLDIWAREIGLDALDPAGDEEPEIVDELAAPDLALDFESNHPADELDRPLDSFELDRAFEQARTEVEEMHDVNRVAERVLLQEPMSFAELAGNDLTPVEASEMSDAVAARDDLGMDAAYVEPADLAQSTVLHEALTTESRDEGVLAVLDRWLQNIERRRAGRVQ